VRLVFSLLLLTIASQAQAWWNNPNAYSPNRMSYWPSVWPAYVQPRYNYNRSPYYGGWNVKGSMNQRGDAHFVIEYNGNINNMQFGNAYGSPYGYPRYQNYMNGWRR